MDVRYHGWGQLDPVTNDRLSGNENDALTPFAFPLDLEKRYVLATRGDIDNENHSMIVPGFMNEDGSGRQEAFAVLTVRKDGKVFVERPAGQSMDVAVNRRYVSSARSQPLEWGNTLSIGTWSWTFNKSEGLFGQNTMNRLAQVDRCHVCSGRTVDGLRVMTCGHNICRSCRRSAGLQIGQQRPMQFPANRQQRIEQDSCYVCKARVTRLVASSSYPSAAIAPLTKLVAKISDADANRPICDNCENKRGLIDSRDYYFCQQCELMLCPPCVLQWHRKHELKKGVDRLRELCEAERKLATLEKDVEALETVETEIKQAETYVGDARNDQQGSATKQLLIEKTEKCRRQMETIRQRKRALARRWDETSEVLASKLAELINEAKQIRRALNLVLANS